MWPFRRIEVLLRKLVWVSRRPVGFSVHLTREVDFMLVYSVTAAPAVDSDTVKRVLTVTINGEVQSTTEYPAPAASFSEVSASHGDQVVLTLVDVDEAGNESAPAVVTFTAADTLPPSQPGEFGVSLVREE